MVVKGFMSHSLPPFLKIQPNVSCHVSHWLPFTQIPTWREKKNGAITETHTLKSENGKIPTV